MGLRTLTVAIRHVIAACGGCCLASRAGRAGEVTRNGFVRAQRAKVTSLALEVPCLASRAHCRQARDTWRSQSMHQPEVTASCCSGQHVPVRSSRGVMCIQHEPRYTEVIPETMLQHTGQAAGNTACICTLHGSACQLTTVDGSCSNCCRLALCCALRAGITHNSLGITNCAGLTGTGSTVGSRLPLIASWATYVQGDSSSRKA
jgi:hypothetical protein